MNANLSPHTPGPWEVVYSAQGYPYQITAPNENRHEPGNIVDITRWAAFCMPSSGEARANAELIAAAPALLDACIQLVACHDEPTCPALDVARAAIAAATSGVA